MRVENLSLGNFSGELRMSQLVNDRKRTQSYCRIVCPPRTMVTSLTFYLAITSCHVPQIQGDFVKYSWRAARRKDFVLFQTFSFHFAPSVSVTPTHGFQETKQNNTLWWRGYQLTDIFLLNRWRTMPIFSDSHLKTLRIQSVSILRRIH